MKVQYRSSHKMVFSAKYHIIWCPKYRRRVLAGVIEVRLADKAATCGVVVVAVKPAHMSQRCAVCGHTGAENRKSQAVFSCLACGHEVNADVNAANNILAAGLAVAARGGTSRSRGPDEARTQLVAA